MTEFVEQAAIDSSIQKRVIRTEDTGNLLEIVLCNVLGIEFKSNNKNDYKTEFLEEANALFPRLQQLATKYNLYEHKYQHTAANGYPYDFSSTIDPAKWLSLKSAKHKNKAKIAPHSIGQSTPTKFVECLGALECADKDVDITVLKQWIQSNCTRVLSAVERNTFDCPIVYYNKGASTIQYIVLKTPIDWASQEYAWTCPHEKWNNSSTLKIKMPDGKYKAILEVQFHSKSRKNMAVRLAFDSILSIFKSNLEIDYF